MTEEAKKRLQEKTEIFYTTLDHKEPKRVPVHVGGGSFALAQAGVTAKECIYDKTMRKSADASKKFMLEFDPDTACGLTSYAGEGEIMELVSPKYMIWPGRPGYNIDDNSLQQFMEDPDLHDEDMDQFFDDNGTWRINKCQPNLCNLYEPLRKFNIPYSSRTPSAFAEEVSKPEMREMIEKCWKLSDMIKESRETRKAVMKELTELGFPSFGGGKACVPYDEWGDEYRGSLLCLTDLYEYPDEVQRFIDANQEEMLDKISKMNPDGKKDGKTVGMTLHRGMDGFLSDEHYRDIYWKHLQQIIEAIMKVNMIPSVFCEGNYATRLDLLRDVPKGRLIYTFEYTPIDLVKSKLGDIATIGVGIRSADLVYKTPDEIRDEVKACIDAGAAGGGYFFRTTSGIDYNAKRENVEAMFDTLHTYGVK